MSPFLHINFVDYAIISTYVLVTIVVGFTLKKYMKTGEDFFLSGRSLPTWITGLAFLSANLGALEVIGMVANSAKYGILTVHYYWIGAIPAMVFLGIFMMPFYYKTKVKSVPEYLKLRYNPATHLLNAVSFAVMTVLMSGISLYAMGLLINSMLGWPLFGCILVSAAVVLLYVFWGGLSSSIYNEVIQFFLIWLGLLPLVYIGIHAAGGWHGMVSQIPGTFMHSWKDLGSNNNPFGVNWLGVSLGLGFVLSFGYWTTDFLVVQRALASENLASAQRTPLLAAFPKMLVPIIVVIPGLLAVSLLPSFHQFAFQPGGSATPPYDKAFIFLMAKYLPNGILGLAITGLLASFMSGMAGNVTAFNTVWTYDIYGSYINKNQPDQHYFRMGHYATVFGVLFSILTAYVARSFPNMMDYMQLVFSFFNAPLFATFLLGMFWKRTTPWGGFIGLSCGILTAVLHYCVLCGKIPLFLYHGHPLVQYASDTALDFWQAFWAWSADFVVTIVVSLFTKQKEEKSLVGLVYSLTPREKETGTAFYNKPVVWGVLALLAALALDLYFR